MGEAKRRGTREARIAQAVEQQRLDEIEDQRQAQIRQKALKFMRIKHQIETRHLLDIPRRPVVSLKYSHALGTAALAALLFNKRL